LLRVVGAGICAADRRVYEGTAPWPLRYPFVPGHEITGIIEEIGEEFGSRGLSPGDAAVVEPIVSCNRCRFCRDGRYHLCSNPRFFGFHIAGGFSDYLVLPRGARIHRLPRNEDPLPAVLAEPLACALHCLDKARVDSKEAVVVAGVGSISRMMLTLLAARRPRLLIALSRHQEGLALARKLGVDSALDAGSRDIVERILESTGGFGPDVFIEASGDPEYLTLGLRSLCKGGRLVLFGVYTRSVDLDANLVADFKELTIQGVHLGPNAFPSAIRLIYDRVVDFHREVVCTYPLSRAVEAFSARDRVGTPGKIVITPQDEP